MRIASPSLLMYIIGFCNIASFSAVTPIIAVYTRESMAASITEVGLVSSAFFLAAASSKLSLGTLAGGRRTLKVFIFSSLVFSLSPIAYALITDILSLIVIRIIHGVAFTFVMPSAVTLTSLAVPKAERDRSISTYTAAMGIGYMTGPAVATAGTALIGIRSSFYLAAVFGFIGLIITIRLVQKMYSIESQWFLFERIGSSENFLGKLSRVFTSRVFMTASIGEFTLFFLFGIMFAYGPVYGKEELGLSNESVGTLFFGYYGLSTCVQLIWVRMIRKGGVRKEDYLLSGILVLMILAFVMAYAGSPLIYGVAFSLVGIGYGIVNPVGLMMVAGSVRSSDLVLANAALMMFFDLGGALAPITTVPIATAGLQYTFIASSAVTAIIMLIIAYLRFVVKGDH